MIYRLALPAVLLIALAIPLGAGPACQAQSGMTAIDASHPLTELTPRNGKSGLAALRDMGIRTVIRYYDSVAETLPCKTLVPEETRALLDAGFSLLAVFQHHNDNPMTFLTPGRGTMDAQRAIELALANGQPSGSAIYFGVDGVDGALESANYEYAKNGGGPISSTREQTLQSSMGAGAYAKHKKFYEIYREEGASLFGGTLGKHRAHDMLPHIESYFRDLQTVFSNFGRQTGIHYRLGVYGGGQVCEHLMGLGLAAHCWLSQSKSLPGYDRFNGSQDWVMRQELTTICPGWKLRTGGYFHFDFNVVNERTHDFGQWNTQIDYAIPFSRPLKRDGVGCYAWED